MKKKVLLVGNDIASPGGIATVNRTLLNSKIISEEFELEILPTWDNKNWKKRFIGAIFELKKIKNIDLVHFAVAAYGSCYRKLIIQKLIGNLPYIIHLHTGRMSSFYSSQNFLLKYLIKRFFKNAKCIICVSQYCKNEIIKLLNIDENKVECIYNGVKLLSSLNNDNNVSEDNKNKETNVLFMGCFNKHRCIKEYLELSNKFKSSPNINFYIAGEGNINHLNNYNVTNLGYIDDIKKNMYLSQMDILIDGSYYESFGISMVECMNRRICVVGRKACAIPEILANGKFGILFNNYEEVQSILTNLISNPNEMQYYKEQSYIRSLDFPIEQFELKIREKYRELL